MQIPEKKNTLAKVTLRQLLKNITTGTPSYKIRNVLIGSMILIYAYTQADILIFGNTNIPQLKAGFGALNCDSFAIRLSFLNEDPILIIRINLAVRIFFASMN